LPTSRNSIELKGAAGADPLVAARQRVKFTFSPFYWGSKVGERAMSEIEQRVPTVTSTNAIRSLEQEKLQQRADATSKGVLRCRALRNLFGINARRWFHSLLAVAMALV